MKRLLLVGAGGFGREVMAWARHIPRAARDWEPAGFLDDNPEALHGRDRADEVRGPVRCHQPSAEEVFAITIGDPRLKLEVAQALGERGATFVTLMHPTAVQGERNQVGRGAILCPHACLTTDVRIGEHVHINVSATFGHDSVAGDGSTISAHADVTGGARLGRAVFLGSHAVILPGIEVGEGARVGAGAVVVRRVAPGAVVFGNPARLISEPA